MAAKLLIIFLFLVALVEYNRACSCTRRGYPTPGYCLTDFLAIIKVNRIVDVPVVGRSAFIRRHYFTLVDEPSDIGAKGRRSIADAPYIEDGAHDIPFNGASCDRSPLFGSTILIGGSFNKDNTPYVSAFYCSGDWIEDWSQYSPKEAMARLENYKQKCASATTSSPKPLMNRVFGFYY